SISAAVASGETFTARTPPEEKCTTVMPFSGQISKHELSTARTCFLIPRCAMSALSATRSLVFAPSIASILPAHFSQTAMQFCHGASAASIFLVRCSMISNYVRCDANKRMHNTAPRTKYTQFLAYKLLFIDGHVCRN